MTRTIVLNPSDTVATCLAEFEAGAELEAGGTRLTVRQPIPYAHKIAIRPMRPGDQVVKYGEVIGIASRAIEPGDWVHVHNVESDRARGDKP